VTSSQIFFYPAAALIAELVNILLSPDCFFLFTFLLSLVFIFEGYFCVKLKICYKKALGSQIKILKNVKNVVSLKRSELYLQV